MLYFGILFVLLVSVTGRIQGWILGKWSAKTKTEIGARQATVSIILYSIISFGFLIIIQTAGIDLQNIANNVTNGMNILFERPIKVWDRIEAGDVVGDVVRSRARSAR